MSRSCFFKLIILLLVWSGFWTIHAQDISFNRITSEQGLSNNMIKCVLQDYRGFIWLGTQDGLNRYDGYTVKIYQSTSGDTNSIIDNYILSLLEDRDSILWIGTINGLNRYNRIIDNFTRFPVSNAITEDARTNQVGAITEDNYDNIWFGNQYGGIYRFNKKEEKYRHYSIPSKSISSLYLDSSGKLWAGTIESEVYLFDREADMFRRLDLIRKETENIPENYIWNFYEDYSGKIVSAASHGVFSWDPITLEVKDITYLPEILSSFRNNEIRYIFEESTDITWIGTWGKGLYQYQVKTGRWTNYQVEPWNPNSISNNDVNVIYKDRGGVIWIGTQEGLCMLDPARNLFKKYQKDLRDPESLHFNFITSFCEDRKGRIWIGTYGGGISLFYPDEEKFLDYQHRAEDPGSLINNAIRAICEDHSGRLWIGTMKGLDQMIPETGTFKHYCHNPNDPGSLCGNDILCVINGKNHDLWIGTYGKGINHVILPENNTDNPEFVHYRNESGNSQSLSNNYIRCLRLSRDGKIWAGTLGSGVDMMDPATGEFTHYQNLPGTTGGLINNFINCIQEDKNGLIWIGTWNGLSCLNRTTGLFTSYTVKDGLPDKNISEIQQDEYGYIWISTFKGLVRFDPEGRQPISFMVYNTENNIQGSKFNINASLKDHHGNLYFGGTTGFNIIDPGQVKVNPYLPRVVLTDLLIFNEPVIIGRNEKNRKILEHAFPETSEILLTHRDKIITIEFAAMSFSQQDKNMYSYYLEGVDKEWVTVGYKRHFATYSNLKSGDYIFRIKAANNDGIWNNEETTLFIRVMPPPWKTWWAFMIYGIMVLSALIIARNYSVSRANLKHKLELEHLEREKSEELNQLKLKFFTNISHEFRTPLTLILGPLERLLENKMLPVKVLDYLDMMNKNARRLLYLINQLMDFRKIDNGNIILKASENDIIKFTYEIKLAFNDFAREHKIRFDFISNVNSFPLWFDHEKLEMVLYNLLSNAFKFTRDNGNIALQVIVPEESVNKKILGKVISKGKFLGPRFQDPDHVVIAVEDTGVGIPKERLGKIFDRFYQVNNTHALRQTLGSTGTGVGLSITKDFVELHKGRITVESEEGQGTIFRVFLPVGNRHLKETEKIKDKDTVVSRESSLESVILADNPESDYLEREKMLAEEQSKSKLRILLVEDNDDIRKFITDCFVEKYEFSVAKNGIEGYELAIKLIPDLIISDIMMPEMNGHEFCSKIKTDIRTSHIPVILLTAYNTLENNIRGYETGADDYIPKPFNTKLMDARIKNLVESRAKLKELFSKDLVINPKRFTLNTTDEKFIEKAIKLVEENMANPEFSVVTLGRELCMSRTNLFRKMKALTDQSASEFIRSIRLKKAAQLLLSGFNVSQTMFEIGINSRSYFNKCFYELFHMTPSEFIKEHTT